MALVGFQEKLAEVITTQVNDYLETQYHYLLLDSFSEIIAISKINNEDLRITIRGKGPLELLVPLSLIETPDGPVISGLFHNLLVRETPQGISLTKKTQLPVRGPVVYDDGHTRLYGTAANYWDTQGRGYSAILANKGNPQLLLPFDNPIGGRHPRAFAAISRSDEYLLFGQPVTMEVQLISLSLPSKNLNLPVDWACIRQWSGQKPDHFKNPTTFANSWDRFLVNGSWLRESKDHIYAVVSFETLECQDAVSFLWVIERKDFRLVERKRLIWSNERPIGFQLFGDNPRWVVAREGNEATEIYIK